MTAWPFAAALPNPRDDARGRGSAELEADQPEAVPDVPERRLEKLAHRPERRSRRVVKEPPEVGDEVLDATALRGGDVAKAIREIDHAEARVPRLVPQHETDEVAEQRARTVLLEPLEEPDGDPLEEDL